jgi:hypothetical protein
MRFYHGTLKRNVSGILRTGLRAGFGFGAEKPGVFLSSSYEDALHWAKEAQENAEIKDGADPAVIVVDLPNEELENVVRRTNQFAKKYFEPLPGDKQYLGSIPAEYLSVFEGEKMNNREAIKAIIKEVFIGEISKATPEFLSGQKYFDKITPFGNYGVLRPPQTEQEHAYNDELVSFIVHKFDELFNTKGYYTKNYLDTDKLADLTADDFIKEPYAGDVVHALAHEATLPDVHKRFKYLGRDPDRPEAYDSLFEILVYWIQSGDDQAVRFSDTAVAHSLTNRLPKGEKPLEDLVADFFERYGSQFDAGIITSYFPNMKNHIGGTEPVLMPTDMQKGFIAAIKNAVSQLNHSGVKTTTSKKLISDAATRFLKTNVGSKARMDLTDKDIATKLMSWYNAIRLKSETLAKKYKVGSISSLQKTFPAKT